MLPPSTSRRTLSGSNTKISAGSVAVTQHSTRLRRHNRNNTIQQKNSDALLSETPQSNTNASATKHQATSSKKAIGSGSLHARVLTRHIKQCSTWQEAEMLFSKHGDEMDAIHACALLVHTSKLAPPARFVDDLLGLLERHLPALGPRGIANSLHALALLGRREPALLRTLMAAAQGRWQGFNPQELSNMAWALAALEQNPAQAWLTGFMAAVQARMAEFGPTDLSTTLWALAKLRCAPDSQWMASYLQLAQEKLGAFDPTSLAAMMHGLVGVRELQAPGEQLAPTQEWLKEVAEASMKQLHRTSNQDLAGVLWGLARAGFQPPADLMATFMRAAGRQWASCSPQELAVLSYALARMGAHPTKVWMGDFLAAVEQRMALLEPREMAMVAWSLAKWDRLPSVQFRSTLEMAVFVKLGAFGSQDLALVVYAMGRWKHLPKDEEWQEAVAQTIEEQASSLNQEECCDILWGLAQMQMRADGAVAAVRKVLMSQMGALGVNRLTMLLDISGQPQATDTARPSRDGSGSASSTAPAQRPAPAPAPGSPAPRDPFLSALLDALQPKLRDVDPSMVSTVGWGLTRLPCPIPVTVTAAFLAACLPALPTLTNHSLASIVATLVKLRVMPDKAWISGFLEASAKRLGNCTNVKDVVVLVLSLAQLRAAPGPEWVAAFVGVVQRVAGEMVEEDLADVLLALGKMDEVAALQLYKQYGRQLQVV